MSDTEDQEAAALWWSQHPEIARRVWDDEGVIDMSGDRPAGRHASGAPVGDAAREATASPSYRGRHEADD